MKTFTKCNPILVLPDTLSTSEYDFMTKERIKEQCICINKQTCIRITELFLANKKDEWLDLLRTVRDNG